MKKAYFIIIATLVVLGSFWAIDSVQGDNILWKLSGGTLAPVNGTWPVSTTQYCLGNSCITVWPSGGGGGSSTVVYGLSPIVVSALSNGNQTTSCPTCLTGNGTSTYIPVFDTNGDLQGYAALTFTSSTGLFSAPSGTFTNVGINMAPSGSFNLTVNGPTNIQSGYQVFTGTNLNDLFFNSLGTQYGTIGTPFNQVWCAGTASALSASSKGTGTNILCWTASSTVGINTTQPSSTLHVIGTLQVSQTSTFVTVTSSQICLGGTCNTTWPAGGSGVATTTINGSQSPTFFIIGDGTTISSTVSGATTTFRSLVTSSSLGVYTNTNQLTNGAGFITTSTNNFGGLTNASITAANQITWSVGNVIGLTNPGWVTQNSSTVWFAIATHNATTTVAANFILASTTCTAANSFYNSTGGGQIQCTAISFPSQVATTSINGNQAASFQIIGTPGQISSTVSGATTTLSLASTSVVAGSYTNCNCTVDAYGRVTSASNGSGGSGGTANATGTVGYMAYFNTATGLVSSTLYYQSSTGNFGIGTSSPAQLLTIYASGTGAYAYIQGNGDGSNYSGFELRDNATPTNRWQFVNSQQDGPNNFEFAQNTGGRGWKFPFTITSSTDFLGINTKTPTAQLEVNGTTQLDATTTILGNMTVSSTAATSTFLQGEAGSPACTGMTDEISSGTFYYFYWKNGQPFFDTNSCQ